MGQDQRATLGVAAIKFTIVTFSGSERRFQRNCLTTTVAARRVRDVMDALTGREAIASASRRGDGSAVCLDADVMRATREAAFSHKEPDGWAGLGEDVRNGLRDLLALTDQMVYGEASISLR